MENKPASEIYFEKKLKEEAAAEQAKEDKRRGGKILLGIIVVIFIIYQFKSSPSVSDNKATEGTHSIDLMQGIKNKVAEDAVKQYEIAEREGDKMQIYVQAGFVSAAYLQAKDEENYRKWKAIEREAGREAGIR